MAAMTGGDLVADVLVRHGVRFLFTLCGGHISPILVSAKARGIRVVDTRHEATAVFAADAVARLTGVPGVAAVTAGPGVTNTITALKNAQLAQSPLVLLGGATATLLRGRGALQDIDQLALVRPHVKRATRVARVRDLAPVLESALRDLPRGRAGTRLRRVPGGPALPGDARARMVRGEDRRPPPAGSPARARLWYVERHLARLFGGGAERAGRGPGAGGGARTRARARPRGGAARVPGRAAGPARGLAGARERDRGGAARRGGRGAGHARLPLGHGPRAARSGPPAAAAAQAKGGAARGRPRDPGRRAVRLPARLRRAHRPQRSPGLGQPQPGRDPEEPPARARGRFVRPSSSCASSRAALAGPRSPWTAWRESLRARDAARDAGDRRAGRGRDARRRQPVAAVPRARGDARETTA